MIIDIPTNTSIKLTNKEDRLGSFDEVFNVDLTTKPNSICLPNRIVMSIDNTDEDVLGLGILSNIVYFDGVYFGTSVGTDSGTYDGDPNLFRGGDDVVQGWTLPTWTGLSTALDVDAGLVNFGTSTNLYYLGNDIVSISTGSDVSFSTESTATSTGGLTTTFNNRVYYFQSGRIESFSDATAPATTGTYTYLVPNPFEVTSVKANDRGVWIATSNDEGAGAKIILWDGVTENVADAEYSIQDPAVLSMEIYKGTPYIVTSSGLLMAFNGSYFEEVARFPFTNIPLIGRTRPEIDLSSSNSNKWIHNNGMAIIDTKLHFLVAPNSQDYADGEDFGDYKKLAGIWCYDEEVGLYHRFALSTDSTDGIPALQGQIKHVGALVPAGDKSTLTAAEVGKFICSASYFTENNDDTENYGIFGYTYMPNSSRMNIGYAVTSKFYSEQVSEMWDSLYIATDDLDGGDSIDIKYKTRDITAVESGITWASTTSFTTTDSSWGDIKTSFEAGMGYECRILYGKGAGVLSQVTNITELTGTYTVTLDRVHTGVVATNTAKARTENWTLVRTLTSADNVNGALIKCPIAVASEWIKYKFVLTGLENGVNNVNNPIINRIVSVSQPHARF
jgi:hypothetical protein